MTTSCERECVYCGNPLIAFTEPRNATAVAKLIKRIGAAGDTPTVNPGFDLATYRVSCNFCERKYLQISTSLCIAEVLKYTMYWDPVPEQMNQLGIDVTDVEQGFRGIAVPRSFAGKVWNTKDFHILFEMMGRTYCMYCHRWKDGAVATDLERIEVTL